MSNIADLQDKIAAMTVDFTDHNSVARSIACKNVQEAKNSAQASALPVRILLPWGLGLDMSATMSEPGVGVAYTDALITWQFQDALLWRPVAQGQGIVDLFYDLREYTRAYFTAALALDLSNIADLMTIEEIDVSLSDFIDYPSGSTNVYVGVIATWTVREVDP